MDLCIDPRQSAFSAKRNVRVGKIDMDTVGAAFLLGVTREDEVVVVRGQASAEDLNNAEVICIEVGGAGEVDRMNFDHHAADGPKDSASSQALLFGVHPDLPGAGRSNKWVLVEYINILDTQGPEALRRLTGGVDFPTLSDVFAGMLLTERNPVEQLHKGVELLRAVAGLQNPFGTIQGFGS